MPTQTATSEAKTIRIVVSGKEKPEEKVVRIPPRALVSDVLNQAGLRGFQLSKPAPDSGFFAATDVLYPAVKDGAKLFASPADVEAGR